MKPLSLMMLSALMVGALNAQNHRFLPELDGIRIDREGYTIIWDDEMQLPKLVAYELTPKELDGHEQCGARYHSDPDFDVNSSEEYEGAAEEGFERGHLFPSSHGRFSPQACLDASHYSNILPQSDSLNRGAWRASEVRAETLAKEHGVVYVHTGPLPIYCDSLPSGMPIPAGFWKTLVYPQGEFWSLESYVFAQEQRIQGLEEMEIGDVRAIEWLIGFEPFNRKGLPQKPEASQSMKNKLSELPLDRFGMPAQWRSTGRTLSECEKESSHSNENGWQLSPSMNQELIHAIREATMMSSGLSTLELQHEGLFKLGDLLRNLSYLPGAKKSVLTNGAVSAYSVAAEVNLVVMSQPNYSQDRSRMTREEKTYFSYDRGALTAFENQDCKTAVMLAKKAIEFEQLIFSEDTTFVMLKRYLSGAESLVKYCENN